MTVRVDLEGDRLAVRFHFHQALVTLIKQHMPGIEWDSRWKIWWSSVSPLQVTRLQAFAQAANEYGFRVDISPPAAARIAQVIDQYMKVVVDGQVWKKGRRPDGLYEWQRQAIDDIKRRRNALLVASMGLGKTPMAIISMAELYKEGQLKPPFLVVSPAYLKEHWRREIEKWAPNLGLPIAILETRKADPSKIVDGINIINYEILSAWADELDKRIQAAVFDEAQRLKNPQAQQSRAAEFVAKKRPFVVELTGTPLVNSHIDLMQPLNILGVLDRFGGTFGFKNRYCPGEERGGAKRKWVEYVSINGGELHHMLLWSCMDRIRREDVLDDLPPIIRKVVPVEITNRAEYNRAEKEFKAWAGEQGIKKGMSAEAVEAKLKRLGDGVVRLKVNALKRVASMGKVVPVCDLIGDIVEEGDKVVAFTYHKEPGRAIVEKLRERGYRVGHVDGDLPLDGRQRAIDDFQGDRLDVIVGTLDTLGVGHTLTKGKTVVFAEMGWTPDIHDQAEARAYARLNDLHGLNSIFLLGERTVDNRVWRKVSVKREVFNQAIDGGESEYLFEVTRDLLIGSEEVKAAAATA